MCYRLSHKFFLYLLVILTGALYGTYSADTFETHIMSLGNMHLWKNPEWVYKSLVTDHALLGYGEVLMSMGENTKVG